MDAPHQPSPPAPGFYPDPGGQPFLREWDGQRWTERTAAQGGTSAPPVRARKWLLPAGIALGVLVLVAVAVGVVVVMRGTDPVVVVRSSGQEIRRSEVAEHLASISKAHFNLERDAGAPQSRERKKLCGHIAGWIVDEDRPLALPLESMGEPLRFPEGPKSFLEACLAAE
ncbi:DUF2510 domain-containing protein [Nonomuraea sp. bgisy101]|uniref:DUF2510 domain-containing protein n=1 Tax=Nonomuraea sp. bgisy101 TaxID=3413784 RepID=UPI003D75977A